MEERRRAVAYIIGIFEDMSVEIVSMVESGMGEFEGFRVLSISRTTTDFIF